MKKISSLLFVFSVNDIAYSLCCSFLYPASQLVDDRALPCGEVSLLNMSPCICYQSQVECQVVYAGNLHGQQLLGLEEMVKICFRVDTVGLAAIFVDR